MILITFCFIFSGSGYSR